MSKDEDSPGVIPTEGAWTSMDVVWDKGKFEVTAPEVASTEVCIGDGIPESLDPEDVSEKLASVMSWVDVDKPGVSSKEVVWDEVREKGRLQVTQVDTPSNEVPPKYDTSEDSVVERVCPGNIIDKEGVSEEDSPKRLDADKVALGDDS